MAKSDYSSIFPPNFDYFSIFAPNKGSSTSIPFLNAYKMKLPDFTTPITITQPTVPFTSPGGAVPNTGTTADQTVENFNKLYPAYRQAMVDQYKLAAALTEEQLASTYPYLSRAASEATARNLAASQTYAAYKEGLPSNVQNIMASKQGQMASAADAEYRRALGMAAQQEAAKNFAGRYQGQTLSYG